MADKELGEKLCAIAGTKANYTEDTLQSVTYKTEELKKNVSAHLSCHPEVNVFCQGRDSILSTELEKQTDTPSTEVSISI